MQLSEILSFLSVHLPAFLAGAVTVGFTKYVDEIFEERREKRTERTKLLEQLSSILLAAEESNWSDLPLSEAKFNSLCRKLAQYNWRLADRLKMNYMTLWIGVIGDRNKKFSKMTKAEKDLYIESLTDLKALNREFHDFAIPDQKLFRTLAWLVEDAMLWLRYKLIVKKGQKAMYPFIKLGRKITKKMADSPY